MSNPDDLTRNWLSGLIKDNGLQIPVDLAMSIYQQESGSGSRTNTSSRGAMGGFQVTPVAAKDVGIDPIALSDPQTNAIAGLKYLDKQFRGSGGDSFAAAARYFGGPDAMSDLSVTDGRVSRGQYATQVMDRIRNKGNSMADQITTPPNGNTGNDSITAQMMEAFGISNKANAAATDAIQNAINISTSETEKSVATLGDIGNLAGDVLLDARKQQLLKAGMAAKRAATAGMDLDGTNDIFASLITEYNTRVDRTVAAENAIHDKESIGWADDPLGFLQANLVDIPNLIDEHNHDARLAKTRGDQLASLNSLVQTQNITDAAQISDLSMQGAASEARSAALKATLEASKLTTANAVQIAGLSVNQATLENKTLNELQQMEQIKTQKAYRATLEAASEERLKKLQADAAMTAKFESDLATLGWTLPAFKGAAKATQDAIVGIISTGKLGDKYEAVLNISNIPTLKLKPGQGVIIKEFQDLYDESGVQGNLAIPKAAEKLSAGNHFIAERFKVYSSDANAGIPRNPYHAPSPVVMLEAIQNVEDITPVFKNVIKTISQATSGSTVDDKAVIQSAVSSIGQNGYTREMAIKDISKYYNVAVDVNNQTKRFGDFNVPVQDKYPISLHIPARIAAANEDVDKKDVFVSSANLFSTKIQADLKNESAVSSLVTLLQVRKQKIEAAGPALINQRLLMPASEIK